VLPGASAAVLTWETRGEIQARGIGGGASIVKVSAGRGAKHPCAAVNRDGETLITWTEGTGWQRGGKLLWRLFDREGKPVGEIGHRDDLAAWNVGACLARPDGSFRVIY
jgi:hypothetical protein